MKERPKIELTLTTTDRVLEILGWGSVFAIWALTVASYGNLPDTIPTHFDGGGEADAFGGKSSLWSLPIIATLLFIAMTILNKYPHIFNYPTKITADNAPKQYANATRIIRYVKFAVVLIFGLIAFKIIQNANGKADGIGGWFLPLTMGLVFIPSIYFIVKSYADRKAK